MIKLGSHNSWSYAKPLKWYLPHFIFKCQDSNIKTQYEIGSRIFDLRLRLKDDNSFGVAHGFGIFNADFYKDLEWLNDKDAYVRVILEYNSEPKYYMHIKQMFIDKCKELVIKYPNIKFAEGRCKWNWEQIYKFDYQLPKIRDSYSSTTSLFESDNKFLRIIDDWWPWLYAKLRNKKNITKFKEDHKDDEYLFMDFLYMSRKYLKE